MRINYNVSAVLANNALKKNDNILSDTMARLSSGLKIVNAKDNPSGLAMANRMHTQIEGLTGAAENANDAISVIQVADGTLGEIHDMLQRLNELCVKSSTGTLTPEDREMIDEEAKQLTDEIARIAAETEFNGQKILDGSFDLRGYTDNVDVKVAYYSNDTRSGDYTIDSIDIQRDANGEIDIENSTLGDITYQDGSASGIPVNAKITSADGDIITITGDNGFELKLEMRTESVTTQMKLQLAGFGAMDMQIGANEGQQIGVRIPKISLENMGISKLDLTTAEDAKIGIDKVKNAIAYVSSARSNLGAYQNRLEHTVTSLDIAHENMTGAYSQIMDADMAKEMTEYTTLQVLTQASMSMLAQANERPAQALQLLQ